MSMSPQVLKAVAFGSLAVGAWFKEHLDGNWHLKTTASPDDYAAQHACANGDEFVLVRAVVSVATTYRMVDGKPTPVAIAFANPLSAGEPVTGEG